MNLALQEPENDGLLGGLELSEADGGLAVAGYDDLFSLFGAGDEFREVGLGFKDVDEGKGKASSLARLSLARKE